MSNETRRKPAEKRRTRAAKETRPDPTSQVSTPRGTKAVLYPKESRCRDLRRQGGRSAPPRAGQARVGEMGWNKTKKHRHQRDRQRADPVRPPRTRMPTVMTE